MVDVKSLSDYELQNELNKLGFSPGPILPSTRKVYEKKLVQLLVSPPCASTVMNGPCELDRAQDDDDSEGTVRYARLEDSRDEGLCTYCSQLPRTASQSCTAKLLWSQVESSHFPARSPPEGKLYPGWEKMGPSVCKLCHCFTDCVPLMLAHSGQRWKLWFSRCLVVQFCGVSGWWLGQVGKDSFLWVRSESSDI
uniref:LEM domain-containing protein n=1 Tax=Canis lupus dingo TaxID=286419 RepID=A0A8C0JWB5_CANLU